MNEDLTRPGIPEQPQAAPPPPENLLGKRILAGIIDFIIIVAIGAVMTALFGDIGEDDNGDFNASLSGLPFLVYVFISFSYFFLLESSQGQTLGKMALGIKVVAADGGRATPGSIAIRTVLRVIDGFFIYLVAVIVIALSSRHQRVGDMAAGTVVVTAPR